MDEEGFGAGILSSIMSKDIRFNPRPWVHHDFISSKKAESREQSFISIHAEVTRKVDALIAANERDLWFEELGLPKTRKIGLDDEKILTNIENKILRN